MGWPGAVSARSAIRTEIRCRDKAVCLVKEQRGVCKGRVAGEGLKEGRGMHPRLGGWGLEELEGGGRTLELENLTRGAQIPAPLCTRSFLNTSRNL